MNHIDDEFIYAVQHNDLDTVSKLLGCGANVQAKNDYALICSAMNGRANIVAKLLEHNANLHAGDDHALRLSAQNGRSHIVSLLLEHNADLHANDDHALRWSARNDHLGIVTLLLERGANVNTNGTYYSALEFSAKYNCLDVADKLLEWNADVHIANDNALRLSIEHGNLKMTEKLLENGADIYCNNKYILKQLQTKFDAKLADVVLPYCNVDDYEYFPECYIRKCIVPTKSANVQMYK